MIKRINNIIDLYNTYVFKSFLILFLHFIGIKKRGNKVLKLKNGLSFKINFDRREYQSISEIFIKKPYDVKAKKEDIKTVLDIGGNIGAYSLKSYIDYPNATIHTFEPDLDVYDILEKNTVKYNNIKIYNIALLNKNSTELLYIDPNNSLISSLYKESRDSLQKTKEIKCIKTSDFLKNNNINNIDLIKFDCEEAEYKIVEDIPKDILSNVKYIVMDTEKHSEKFNIMRLYLEKNNFVFVDFEPHYLAKFYNKNLVNSI